jgi:hypothetical protein
MKAGVTQLHLGDAERGLCIVGCNLRMMPRELSERTGIVFENSQDDLDYMEAALIRNAAGKQFGLMRYLRSPRSDYTAMLINEKSQNVSDDVNDGLEALGVDTSLVISFHPDYRFEPHSVWRQDDHGNRFLAGEFLCRSDATNAMDKLASRQHKQSYWVEKAIA